MTAAIERSRAGMASLWNVAFFVGWCAFATVPLARVSSAAPSAPEDAPSPPAVPWAVPPAAQDRKGLIAARYPRETLAGALLPRAEWKPFPRASEREAWGRLLEHPLNAERKRHVVARAEALIGEAWPRLPATLYMEFARDGNRSRYEAPYFARREALATLVLAECLEGEGRFLDEIANGIWAIAEESTWCLPAHATRLPGDVLHRLDVEGLDLFACETGMTLAQTHYLLGDRLRALSPSLAERIPREVRRRILDPYATGDGFGSSGWVGGGNNWAPWCASNILGAALYLQDDSSPEGAARLAGMVGRLVEVVDRFIDGYGEDGGCDEGPSYWNEAGGALLVFLELLRSRTGGRVDIYDDPKIAAMGLYILRAHLAGPWFANFADADAKAAPHPGKVWRYGERIGSEPLKAFALLVGRDGVADGPIDPPLRLSGVSRALLGPLMEMFWVPADAVPRPLVREATVWLPDVQVLFARESATSDGGLVLAAKAGHNAESHNHNDVGQFIIALDGRPAIIDLGRETYTRKTFGRERYDLWFTRGLGHNAPVVNGVEQAPGRRFAAGGVRLEETPGGARLSMDLAAAYPREARIASLSREVEYARGPSPRVRVRDYFELSGNPGTILLNLYAAHPAERVAPGTVAIRCGPRPLVLEVDPAVLAATVTPVEIEDEVLREAWGDRVFRISLELRGEAGAEGRVGAVVRSGAYELIFRPGEG